MVQFDPLSLNPVAYHMLGGDHTRINHTDFTAMHGIRESTLYAQSAADTTDSDRVIGEKTRGIHHAGDNNIRCVNACLGAYQTGHRQPVLACDASSALDFPNEIQCVTASMTIDDEFAGTAETRRGKIAVAYHRGVIA